MKHQIMLPFFFLIALVSSGYVAAKPSGVRVSLFNGQNLNGWHVTNCEVAVEDGLMVAEAGNGLVRTDHQYKDFVLEWACRPRKADKWDSGVYFRCELPKGKRPWPKRYQINLLQGQEGNGVGLPEAVSKGLVKAGEWNQFKLSVVGERAELEINGKPAWKTDGIESPQGYIGLQVEAPGGGQFEFKNIYVTELDARPLFNGTDLSGWEGGGAAAELCWKVTDGELLCTGAKGPWLRSVEEFDDFNLRLDYKLKAGGNSGVYLRVAKDGAHRDPGQGVEIQVLDDRAERYRTLKAYQYTGSVYAIAAAQQHVGREPGQWNALEMDCHGSRYRITHNGITIIDADIDEFPALGKRRMAGFLGLQNHSEEVWYRNIRVGASQMPDPTAEDSQ
ncbi:MAG: DUF1080 domain-containing protein [Pirellulaceae bacterium]|nr:DUF1080 domain-containing protein [Pirellulaceae bacterium]